MNDPDRHSSTGKLLYGLLFVVLLPVLLFLWAQATVPFVPLPVPQSRWPGTVLAFLGLAMTSIGIADMMRYGKGLPMNAYPPQHHVSRGIYRFFAHPIYIGFCLLLLGASWVLRSPSGLWLVFPLVALGCASLVLGFEKHDLERRFGANMPAPLISLPGNNDTSPTAAERLSVYVLVLLPWLVIYEAVVLLGSPPDAVEAFFAFERTLPVIEWTELFYGGTYLFVLLVPLIARSSRTLRQFSLAGLTGTVIVTILFITVPLVATPRAFTPSGILGHLLLWERSLDAPIAAFPSFHVIWAFWAARAYAHSIPRWRMGWWIYAILISLSCITTGMHALIDVLGGVATAMALFKLDALWQSLRNFTERIANSWKEWHFGPVRIINHGMYGGIGTCIGLTIVGSLLGRDYVIPMLFVASAGLISAALWAQYIEGSPSLLRPYGFYGGVMGIVVAALSVSFSGVSSWLLLGAFSVAAPVIQAVGRMRCLVQGCCHGRIAPASVGIRYNHPQSRVSFLADLRNVPIHATPLYSILWNTAYGIILARLWSLGATVSLVVGLYFILNGLGRFVEEAYRGEPQTPIIAKLRLYQWIAIASIATGAVVTTIDPGVAIPPPDFTWPALTAAFGFGFVTWLALGLDFPDSNKRFSRLT